MEGEQANWVQNKWKILIDIHSAKIEILARAYRAVRKLAIERERHRRETLMAMAVAEGAQLEEKKEDEEKGTI